MRKLGYLSAFTLPLIVVIGYYLGGWFHFSNVVFVFLVIPLMDELVGKDTSNVTISERAHLSEERFFRYVTFAWVYVQFSLILWAAWAIAQPDLQWIDKLGLTLSVALTTGGIGITVAHELGHKKSKLERFYAKALLLSVCYMHFYIEHNRGHHVHVATPEDPATARRGESFYVFWFRAVTLSYLHAWQLENDRMKRAQKPWYHVENEMIRFTLLPILFAFLLSGFINWLVPGAWSTVLLFFFVQSLFAFTLLELVDYIEHYGIVRAKLQDGRYERVNPLHSWNANHTVSNFFLFQLQRHSDHHTYAIKRYQVLDHIEESPQLPAGYPAMIVLALLPPIWHWVMDKKLNEWMQQRMPTHVA
jgi:alkane 1-monooxygenase